MLFENLEDYMVSCTNKKIFGVECPGCGAQRATAFFFRGEFEAAFTIYPAIYTIILLLGVVLLNFFIKFKYAYQLKMGLLFLTVAIIVVSYVVKMSAFV